MTRKSASSALGAPMSGFAKSVECGNLGLNKPVIRWMSIKKIVLPAESGAVFVAEANSYA